MHSDWVCLSLPVCEGDLIVMQVGDAWFYGVFMYLMQ